MERKIERKVLFDFSKILTVKIENIGIGPAFINVNQSASRFAEVCQFFVCLFPYKTPGKVVLCLNTIFTNIGVNDFNIS